MAQSQDSTVSSASNQALVSRQNTVPPMRNVPAPLSLALLPSSSSRQVATVPPIPNAPAPPSLALLPSRATVPPGLNQAGLAPHQNQPRAAGWGFSYPQHAGNPAPRGFPNFVPPPVAQPGRMVVMAPPPAQPLLQAPYPNVPTIYSSGLSWAAFRALSTSQDVMDRFGAFLVAARALSGKVSLIYSFFSIRDFWTRLMSLEPS